MTFNIFRACRFIRTVLTICMFLSIAIFVTFITRFGQERSRNLPLQRGLNPAIFPAMPALDAEPGQPASNPPLLRERLAKPKSSLDWNLKGVVAGNAEQTVDGYKSVLNSTGVKESGPNLDKVKKLLLFGYFRGGTSFAGELFAENRESFYMFEPLHSLEAQYEKAKRRGLRGGGAKAQKVYEMKLERQMRIVYGILNCKMEYLLKADGMLFRDSNFLYRDKKVIREVYTPLDCFGKFKQGNNRECFNHIQESCRNSSVVVIKENRLRMFQVEKLLEHDPSIYVVHYTRDPRGIASSAPYSALATRAVRANPKGIAQATERCADMLNDTLIFNKLKDKYPDRTRHVRYEDLGMNPLEVGQTIYDFISEVLPESVHEWLERNTESVKNPAKVDHWGTKRKSSDVVYKWREKLSPEVQRAILQIPECATVIKELGYALN